MSDSIHEPLVCIPKFLEAGDAIAVQNVLSELGQVELLRLLLTGQL